MAPPSDHILPHLSSPRTHQTNKQPQHLKHLGIHQQPIGRGPRSSTTWLMHYEGRQSTKGSGFAPRGRTQPTSDNQPSQCAGDKNKPRIPKPNLAGTKLNRLPTQEGDNRISREQEKWKHAAEEKELISTEAEKINNRSRKPQLLRRKRNYMHYCQTSPRRRNCSPHHSRLGTQPSICYETGAL